MSTKEEREIGGVLGPRKRSSKCKSYTEREIDPREQTKSRTRGKRKRKEISGSEMLEYMRKIVLLRQTPEAEANFSALLSKIVAIPPPQYLKVLEKLLRG